MLMEALLMSNAKTVRRSWWSRTGTISWREFKHTALTKAFFFGAVVVPMLFLGVGFLVPFMVDKNAPPIKGTVAVIDPTGKIAAAAQHIIDTEGDTGLFGDMPAEAQETIDTAVATQGGGASAMLAAADTRSEIDLTWEIYAQEGVDGAPSIDALKDELKSGNLVALILVNPNGADAKATAPNEAGLSIFVPTSSSPKHQRLIGRAFETALQDARVQSLGITDADFDRVRQRPQAETFRISPTGGEAEEINGARMLIPAGFMFLMWICVFTSANQLLTSTIEEKSNKVMEVLLAAASPMQLLAGKILGQALVSVIMLVMYGGAAIAGLTAASMNDLITTSDLILFALYFIMAYFMIATLMVAVGSAVSDLREAQSLVGPVMILLIIPIMLWLPISESPNGMLATIASFVPPGMPFIMILRVTAANEPVPMWQIIASLVWGYGAMFGMLWLGARIFRVGVLMQGKPPTPKELLKWAFVR